MKLIKKYLPIVSLSVGVAAMVFQINYLYPWHEELEEKFRRIEKEHELNKENYEQQKFEKIANLEKKIELLNSLLDQSKNVVSKITHETH